MDKKPSGIKNLINKLQIPTPVEDKPESYSSSTISSQDTALPTILGSLKLCDKDTTSKNSLNKYKSIDTLYDIIIRINNLSDLRSEGWEILVGKHTKSVIPIAMISENSTESTKTSGEAKEGVIATVLGAYNRGKTYLLKKLCKVELPSGNLISTEGISITAGRENYTNLVFLDTAGTDTPVKSAEIEFKRATEALLREVVLHLSTCIIIVVNRLRATDQIYIKEILKYCRNDPERKKTIIIVHNFLDIQTIEDLDQVIQNEIIDIFEAKLTTVQLVVNRVHKTIKYFISTQNSIDIRHYVLAKAHSNPAEIWNKQSLDAIMNLLQNSENKRRLDLINDMIKFINNKLPQLFKQDDQTQQNMHIVQHESKPCIVHIDRQYRDDLKADPINLELSEKLVYDDAGYFIRNESGQWQPRYNLYDNEDNYCLIIEVPGFKQGQLNTKRTEKYISISGSRPNLNRSLTNSTVRQSDIPIGSFQLNVPFHQHVNFESMSTEREDGFLRLTIPKKKTNELEESV